MRMNSILLGSDDNMKASQQAALQLLPGQHMSRCYCLAFSSRQVIIELQNTLVQGALLCKSDIQARPHYLVQGSQHEGTTHWQRLRDVLSG